MDRKPPLQALGLWLQQYREKPLAARDKVPTPHSPTDLKTTFEAPHGF
jgi:hypothetical protein